MPPPRIIKLGKYELINYIYTLESWRFEAALVKSSIERVEDLIEGMWNTCLDVLADWRIGEIEESLESLTSKNEVVEQRRVASAIEVQELEVVDSKAMHFSLISPAQMISRVNEHDQIPEKGIKEVTSLMVQGHLHDLLIKGPKAKEIMEISDKWVTWETSMGKTSGV